MVNKYINATYQEIYDLATSPDKVTIIGIRTPSGSVPSTMLSGLWKQFKSVKYLGCDFVMRATARQPLDPLQIGTTAGSQMDMRDVQNPILFRGCHGESLGEILNDLMSKGVAAHTFSGDSLSIDESALDDVENFYYQCLTDMSWQKSMPENGFARSGLHPLVYGMATNAQLTEVEGNSALGAFQVVEDTSHIQFQVPNFGAFADGANGGRRVFTNDLQPLGWMDTQSRVGGVDPETKVVTEPCPIAYIPRAYMGILMLPPAYSEGIRQFFRCVITHHFVFKDFRSISLDSDYASTPGYYDTLNVSEGGKVVLTSAAVR